MRKVNPAAVTWLLQTASPEHWAELYFKGRRCSHLTSNIAESLNAWILEAREKPILAMFESIRQQLMQWFAERRESELTTNGLLVSKSAKKLEAIMKDRARRYHFEMSDENIYEVLSEITTRNYIVNIAEHTCTCLL